MLIHYFDINKAIESRPIKPTIIDTKHSNNESCSNDKNFFLFLDSYKAIKKFDKSLKLLKQINIDANLISIATNDKFLFGSTIFEI